MKKMIAGFCALALSAGACGDDDDRADGGHSASFSDNGDFSGQP